MRRLLTGGWRVIRLGSGTLLVALMALGCFSSHRARTPCPEGDPRCECAATAWVPAGRNLQGEGPRPCDYDRVASDTGSRPSCSYAPEHLVTIEYGYGIGRVEATAGCVAACVQAGACDPLEDHRSQLDLQLERRISETPTAFESPGWYWDEAARFLGAPLDRRGAEQYCEWLGGRLPSEAEWERAARGDESRWRPWTTETADLCIGCCDYASLPGCDRVLEQEVATFAGEVYGTFDMLGGLGEWTATRFPSLPATSYTEGEVVLTAPPAPAPAAGPYTVVRGVGFSAFERAFVTEEEAVFLNAPAIGVRCVFDGEPTNRRSL